MKFNDDEIFYRIALSFVPGIGAKLNGILINAFGDARSVLTAGTKKLLQVEGMGTVKAAACKDAGIYKKAEQELAFLQQHAIRILLPEDPAYPSRLHTCNDAPALLYYKGTANLNAARTMAVIGTRKHTEYGLRLCQDLVSGFSGQKDLLLVSGLAHGIDTIAHKAALQHQVDTVGVLGHGLDTLYPAANKRLAADMLQTGGLLTEFPSGSPVDKGNFPARNRIVAGLADVTVVVESDIKGGALITAYIANSYNREVAAFPGRAYDTKSSGTNKLIRENLASLITSAADLNQLMNWNTVPKPALQKQLHLLLTPEEQSVIDLLARKDTAHADELLLQTGMGSSVLAATLLQLEVQGLVKCLPGKNYRLN